MTRQDSLLRERSFHIAVKMLKILVQIVHNATMLYPHRISPRDLEAIKLFESIVIPGLRKREKALRAARLKKPVDTSRAGGHTRRT